MTIKNSNKDYNSISFNSNLSGCCKKIENPWILVGSWNMYNRQNWSFLSWYSLEEWKEQLKNSISD